MLDLETQSPITLNEARRLPFLRGREGKDLSLDSIYRWAGKGIGGVVLETVRIGGRLFTTVEAVRDFIARLNRPGRLAAQPAAVRRREIADASKRLDEKGI